MNRDTEGYCKDVVLVSQHANDTLSGGYVLITETDEDLSNV